MNHTHTNETVTELTESYVLSVQIWPELCEDSRVNNVLRCIYHSINKQNVFPEDSRDMGYVVREPIINATFGDIRFRR